MLKTYFVKALVPDILKHLQGDEPFPASVLVDLDGTLCTKVDDSDGDPDYAKAQPIPEMIEAVNRLYDRGDAIIVWTARGGMTGKDWWPVTSKQLDDWGVRYVKMWIGKACAYPKPHFSLIIDDKALSPAAFLDAIQPR